MNKLYKAFITLLLPLLVFSVATVPIAADNESNFIAPESTEPTETGTTIELVPYGPTPFATFTGNFGVLRINYMSSNKSIAWSISSPGIDEFAGNIKVEDRANGKVRYYAVSGFGGTVSINVTKGRTYNVSLIGTGYAFGGRPVATTVPNSIFVAP